MASQSTVIAVTDGGRENTAPPPAEPIPRAKLRASLRSV